MALLSRDEFDIRWRLERSFDHVKIAAHTEDVRLYVASEVERRIASGNLAFRRMSLKDTIIAELVRGAQGM